MIAPKVREMDEKEVMDPEIIKGLFENGVRTTTHRTGVEGLTFS